MRWSPASSRRRGSSRRGRAEKSVLCRGRVAKCHYRPSFRASAHAGVGIRPLFEGKRIATPASRVHSARGVAGASQRGALAPEMGTRRAAVGARYFAMTREGHFATRPFLYQEPLCHRETMLLRRKPRLFHLFYQNLRITLANFHMAVYIIHMGYYTQIQ